MSHARSELKDFKALAPDANDMILALSQARRQGRHRQAIDRTGQAARVADQRLRLLRAVSHPAGRESRHFGGQAQSGRVWREAPLFSARERAALAWTEALTLVTGGVSDEVYAQASAEFSKRELAYLSSAIASINVWNRLGVAYRWTPPARSAR